MNFNYISDNLLSISIDEKDDLINIKDILNVFEKVKNKPTSNISDLEKNWLQINQK